jgi:hypothetical protein
VSWLPRDGSEKLKKLSKMNKSYEQQYNEYKMNGGQMSQLEWSNDGRFDASAITVKNQIILNNDGNSWMGFFTSDNSFESVLKELLRIANEGSVNQFWVIDFDGKCRAAQSSLNGALRFYDNNRSTLVHTQKTFV